MDYANPSPRSHQEPGPYDGRDLAETVGHSLPVDLDAIERELSDVELALARLDDGTYGRCELCSAVIDDSVLVDLPAIRRCSAHL
ncbi:MAG: hypothetical protein ACYCTL_02770 [Acidimicrobiales bacterium]